MVIDIHRRRHQAFISHSRRDDAFVNWLTGMLRLRGVSYWRDQREIEVGDPVVETIRNALADVYCFVIVLSPEALQSKWVIAEIREAVSLSDAGHLRIVPILLADCDVPPELAKFDYADFRQGRAEAELDRLVRSVQSGADRIEGKL
jgi:TIR domain